MSFIQVEMRGSVVIVTLNRPESLNAFHYHMLLELDNEIEKIMYDKNVQIVIFTGAGDKAFSTGADLKERKTLTDHEVKRNVHKIRTVFQKIAELPQPTIAAVNGYAFGGGFELILACDIRIAHEKAVMGLTETSWGIIPGAGGTQRLPRIIGESKAKDLIFTARKMTAKEAYEYGILLLLVNEDVLSAAISYANKILRNAPIAVQQAKFAIHQGMNMDLKTSLELEGKAYEITIPTKDRIEALQAFAEKRTPKFKGE